MATEQIVRDCESVHGYVARVCFKNGPPSRVGAEVEWLVACAARPLDPPALPLLHALQRDADPLPGGSRLTLEPGGQVELSSPAADSLLSCWQGLRRDTAELRERLAERQLAPLPAALDPLRTPVRLLRTPRYDAMQAFFDARGPDGLTMMTCTAALQVNLDAGADAADVGARWRLLHALGPALVAAFANSPLQRGRPTGWKSTRQGIWSRVQRSAPDPTGDPATAWAEFALDAPVMLLRAAGAWRADPGFSFREWVAGAGTAPPTEDDLAYHLTTLFPPVRPRGWLEVRYLDAQPGELWAVPVAVLVALTADARAADRALAAVAPVAGRWTEAARDGLADPALRAAALGCFEAALTVLPRVAGDPALTALVESFTERYVARGRCPGDDLLDRPARSGRAANLAHPDARDDQPRAESLEIG